MRALVKRFELREHMIDVPCGDYGQKYPSGVVDLTFEIELPRSKVNLNLGKYKRWDEVDVYLVVRKKPKRRKR